MVTLLPTSGKDKQKIIEAIEGLTPAGSTPGESAIRVAYKLAKKSFIRNGNNRVILATDGDFNVGQNTEKELEELIALERKSGIYLTCLGVGMGNYKDSKLEALAKNGNGNFAYLDNEKEAEKVLIEEFAQTLYTVANNVQLTVKFDPGLIKSYRLIGFDNKEDAIADSSSQLEGGEVGSGHSLLSVFEIMPVASDTAFINTGQTVGTLKLSYKLTVEDEPVDEEFSVLNNYQSLDNADSCLRFATSIVMFGTLLKQSKFAKDVSWDDVQSLAMGCADKKNLLQMEFIQLIEKARKLYPVRNRKKGNLLSLNRTRSKSRF
jgi:Ca-activated chloride channel family protein